MSSRLDQMTGIGHNRTQTYLQWTSAYQCWLLFKLLSQCKFHDISSISIVMSKLHSLFMKFHLSPRAAHIVYKTLWRPTQKAGSAGLPWWRACARSHPLPMVAVSTRTAPCGQRVSSNIESCHGLCGKHRQDIELLACSQRTVNEEGLNWHWNLDVYGHTLLHEIVTGESEKPVCYVEYAQPFVERGLTILNMNWVLI